MTKLLQKAFDEASKLPDAEQDTLDRILLDELVSERRWGELFAGSQIYLLNLLTKHWQSTVRGRPRSLTRANCDLAYHCAVPEDVFGAAGRGSTSSASSLSDLPTKPEPTESSFQACSSYTANLFGANQSGYRAVGILESDEIVWYWIGLHADYDKLLSQSRRRL